MKNFESFPPASSIRRILVCQLRQIGDVLLSTPAIELLARQYPQAEIHVFTEKKCLPMLQGNPNIQKVWGIDKKALPTLWHEMIFYRHVTANKFDLVVDFQQLPRCRWVVAFSKAKERISFPPPWYTRWLYTRWHKPTPSYAAAYKAGVLESLGIFWQGERPRLYLSDDERATAQTLLQNCGLLSSAPSAHAPVPFITVDATHRHATRRWPATHYAKLMDMIVDAVPDMHFLLPYGPGEEEELHALRALCKHKSNVILPKAMLSLRHMAACMEHAVLHLGNCSSPRHIAVAVDVATFTILGSTSGGWTFPSPEHVATAAQHFMDMPCQPCNKNTCPYEVRCLTLLTPELVAPLLINHLETYGKKTV